MELGGIGANGCAQYLDEHECADYAREGFSVNWERVDSWSNYPKGCFWQTENNYVYFNKHTTGAGISRPATTPVCKIKKGKIFLFVTHVLI